MDGLMGLKPRDLIRTAFDTYTIELQFRADGSGLVYEVVDSGGGRFAAKVQDDDRTTGSKLR